MNLEKQFRIFFNHTMNAGVVFYRLINFHTYMCKDKSVSIAFSQYKPDNKDIAEWELLMEKGGEQMMGLIKEFDSLMSVANIAVWQMVHMRASYSLFRAYREIYDRKKVLLVELDDDVFHVNRENAGYSAYNPNSDPEYYAEMQIRNANGLIVSTEYLKKLYLKYNPVIEVIPNAIDFNIWDKVKTYNDKKFRLRIGWAGGQAHEEDMKIMAKVIPIILKDYPKVEFVFLGGRSKYLPIGGRVKHIHKWFPMTEYPAELGKLGLDIGLAPLRDNFFNRAKSNLRWLEYSALKIPTVASNVEPFKNAEIKVDYEVDEWVTALRKLIEDREYRLHAGTEAYKAAKKDFNVETIAKKYLDLLKSFYEGKKEINVATYDEKTAEKIYDVTM